MIIRLDNYGEYIYDKNIYTLKKYNELVIGEIVMLKDFPGKITNISYGRKNGMCKFIKCVGIFDDIERENIELSDYPILLPIIQTKQMEFLSMSNKIIELYEQELNEIVEFNIDEKIDKHIVEKILNKISANETNFNIIVKQFLHWIRIIDVIE